MPDFYEASRDLEDAQRKVDELDGTPGLSRSSERAKAARKKLKEAKAAFKAAQAAHEKNEEKETGRLAMTGESVDAAIAFHKGKKGGKTKKVRRGKSRSTRRRV
jgi:hypothetical protein